MNEGIEEVDLWDLDHTMLNTERKLFGPILDHLSEQISRPRSSVSRSFDRVCSKTFSWENWFADLGLDRSVAHFLRREYERDIGQRIESCIYPGIVDTIRRRKARGVLPALVTAGDPAWQEWKFLQARSLAELIDAQHRHYVPLNGSKAEVIARYRGARRLNDMDDSGRWHREAIALGIPHLRHARPQWPDTDGTKLEPEDGTAWTVTRTIEELDAWLEEA